jgi:hypothetical protein
VGDIVLLLILAVIGVMNVAATVQVGRDEYSEPRQKVLQIILVWIVPILGALVVLAVHRKPEKPSGTYRAADDGIGDDFGASRPFGKSIGDVLDGD